MQSDLDHLTDNRSDPDARSVLEDMERSRYRTSTVSRLSEAAEVPEEIHRLVIRRSLPASTKAWSKHCPRPADWRDDD